MPTLKAHNILVWLPSPLGDAIMSTPALRAFRSLYPDANITFLASPAVLDFLAPLPFCNNWKKKESFLKTIIQLRQGRFDAVILLKNSFGSALAATLAGIKRKIGYGRDARSILLTDKIFPEKETNGKFKPVSAVDYYLNIAAFLGSKTKDKRFQIGIRSEDFDEMADLYPQLLNLNGPLVIFVPGGAFGPSKLWPAERFSELADMLKEKYNATVLVSIAPNPQEKAIAEQIRSAAKHPLLTLAEKPLRPGPLKALFQKADLVITNDTGPRHIAIALSKQLVTLFGPNNPAWTQTDYPGEIQIIGKAPCAPCDKPVCRQNQHYCMESITVQQIMEAAGRFLNET